VTAPFCATGCGRSSPDAFLCSSCTARLTRAYAEMPAQLRDLEITLTRQARAGKGDGKATKKAEQPIPFDVAASELAHAVRTALSTQLRHLCESRGIQCPTIGSTASMARWLLSNVDSIRQDEAAADLFNGTMDIVHKLRSAVDNHGKRFVGECTATIQPVEMEIIKHGHQFSVEISAPIAGARKCGKDLRMKHGDTKIRCDARDPETKRMVGCGATYDAKEYVAGRLGKMGETYERIGFIGDALAMAGYMKAATARQWVKRGKVYPWREDELGHPLYRVGDFLDLIEKAKTEAA
jgi:hypothetical protein